MEKDDRKVINWTPAMLRRMKTAYKAAVEGGRDTFVFDGNEFVTSYAKYLIQYLDSLFGNKQGE